MIVYNKTKSIIVSKNVNVADSFLKRFLGLIPKKKLEEEEGLLITKCSSVHTFFMSFPIDVVFINKNLKVIDVITIKPWKVSKFYDSDFVIEFNAGFLNGKISCGDEIELR